MPWFEFKTITKYKRVINVLLFYVTQTKAMTELKTYFISLKTVLLRNTVIITNKQFTVFLKLNTLEFETEK